MRVAYCGGFWATNVGNAFYDMGCMHVLKKVYGEENVRFVTDLPGWFWGKGGMPDKAWNPNARLEDFDLYLLSGPVFHKWFPTMYQDTFVSLKKSGVKIGFISCGLSKYSAEEIKMAREFLEFIEPEVMITRDDETFEAVGDIAKVGTGGLCHAFYIDECHKDFKLGGDPIIVYNFDINGEPAVKLNTSDLESMSFSESTVTADGKRRLNLPTKEGRYEIVRTVHNCFDKSASKMFGKPNSYYSDLPENYLGIYSNSNLTLSNRVHACVATLAFGNPAMYLTLDRRSTTKRTNLFKVVGAGDLEKKPVKADRSLILERKAAVEKCLAKLG